MVDSRDADEKEEETFDRKQRELPRDDPKRTLNPLETAEPIKFLPHMPLIVTPYM